MNGYITREECKNTHETMAKKIDKIDERTRKMELELARLPEHLLEKMDERYASKRLEKIVWFLIGLMITTTIGVVGYLLDKFVIK